MKQYDEEFKKKIIRLHLEEGQSLKGLADEYGVSKAAISKWTKLYREECQITASTQSEYDYMQENLKLRKQLEEMGNENSTPKMYNNSLEPLQEGSYMWNVGSLIFFKCYNIPFVH